MSVPSPSVCPKLPIVIPSFSSSVLLVDSCRVSRDFLSFMIGKRDNRLKVFCAPKVARTIAGEFDLIILNMHTTSIDDRELAGQLMLLKANSRGVPFMVIIDADHDHRSASLLWRFDLRGYILNSLHPATLAAAIRLICGGGPYQPMLPPVLSRVFASAEVEPESSLAPRRGPSAGPTFTPAPSLTPDPVPDPVPASIPGFTSRETDVLGLLQQGKPNKVIAHELVMSVNTAKVHVRNIMRKLRATNRTQVVIGTPPQSRTALQ